MMLICIDAKISINNKVIEIDRNVHIIKRELYEPYKDLLVKVYEKKYYNQRRYKNDKDQDCLHSLTVDFSTFEVADTKDIDRFTKDELFKNACI